MQRHVHQDEALTAPASSGRLRLVLTALVGLLLAVPRTGGAAACHSTCARQLVECKRTCPGGGQARRECRAACAERSTCTAPGASIRTLAYVVTECTTDPQGRSALGQKLLVRRGNCDPVTVMEVAAPTPVPDPNGICRAWSSLGFYNMYSISGIAGIFQHLAVLPDGSGVVFELKKPIWPVPSIAPELPEEGIFIVRAGKKRRLGPAGLLKWFWYGADSGLPPTPFQSSSPDLFLPLPDAGTFPINPKGRTIALVDLGPDTDGNTKRQIFLLNLRSGRRARQLTHQTHPTGPGDPGVWFVTFLDSRTIGFSSGPTDTDTFTAFQVKTDGRGFKEIPAITLSGGARVVSEFAITGTRPHVVAVAVPSEPPDMFGTLPREIVLVDGKNLLQLTKFGRQDTGPSVCCSFVARGRAFFRASANPVRENPAEICQLFSINTDGGDLRQITHLPSRGQSMSIPGAGCFGDACGVSFEGIMADQVTGTVLFSSDCDPTGGNPSGLQIFAMRPDGTELRQLTATPGMTTDPNGTIHVEMPGPYAYQTPVQGG